VGDFRTEYCSVILAGVPLWPPTRGVAPAPSPLAPRYLPPSLLLTLLRSLAAWCMASTRQHGAGGIVLITPQQQTKDKDTNNHRSPKHKRL
jgi:hypothetical protein